MPASLKELDCKKSFRVRHSWTGISRPLPAPLPTGSSGQCEGISTSLVSINDVGTPYAPYAPSHRYLSRPLSPFSLPFSRFYSSFLVVPGFIPRSCGRALHYVGHVSAFRTGTATSFVPHCCVYQCSIPLMTHFVAYAFVRAVLGPVAVAGAPSTALARLGLSMPITSSR